jgi:tetratricopeptide (TPR) repeat protein
MEPSDAKKAAALNARGVELAESADYAAAEAVLRRAGEANSDDAFENLGKLLAILGRPMEALRAYEEAARRGSASAQLAAGDLLYEELGDVKGAIRALKQAARAGETDAYVNLAFLHEADAADHRSSPSQYASAS